MLNSAEIKKKAIEFQREHADDADEKSQAQNFWRDFFGIFGLSPQRIGVFESRARTLKGTVGFIDFFWPGTLLVEHKSRGKDLDAALRQALDYCSGGGSAGGLKDTELPRNIVVSDFARFRVLELGSAEDYAEFPLAELHENLHRFNFILGYEQRTYKDEDPVNIAAAERMGALHDDLKRNGYGGHDLELLLVRLMFLFFADDTGIFPKDQFSYLMEHRTRSDGSDLGPTLAQVFQVLNTPVDRRMKNLDADLALLPYVNGGLFAEQLPVPSFDEGMRAIFLHCCLFDWSRVSPAIFGSLFQSVMDARERRNLGAHYTSEKNILKTIHGLFLDELKAEFHRSIGSAGKLRSLAAKIAGLRLLDPACGCGNFLILAYRELRLLEIAIHKEIQRLEKHKYLDLQLYRGIDVDAMYGIEIEEFPAQIARTALWIMDHLMNVRLSEEFGEYIVRLPLTATPHIVQGNALRLDWKEIVPPEKLNYILGNPPFVGSKMMNDSQREDMAYAIGHVHNYGLLDLVTAWYVKSADYLQGTDIAAAFVSTNSISQGEQVGVLWNYLLSRGVHIDFAHRTFKWTNEARGVAAVFCVIVGFGLRDRAEKRIYDYPDIRGEPVERIVKNINPYLVDSRSVIIGNRNKPLCPVPEMGIGNKPIDGGNYLFTDDEKAEFIRQEPQSAPWFRMWLGSDEFLNGRHRWVLWLGDCPPAQLRSMPRCLERVERVRAFRLASKSEPTRKIAATPTRFHVENMPKGNYLVVPEVSSERREFIPIGFLTPDVVCSNLVKLVPDATLYHFGVLQSTMHMAWTRQVCGRLKSDYRYSNKLVYNNFPWPDPSVSTQKVEECAQGVLDARARFPGASLADLYDPLTMPAALAAAHRELDRAVDRCYRKEVFKSELERVEFLFGLYEGYMLSSRQ